MNPNPLFSALKTIGYALSGRLHFPSGRVGESLRMGDGRSFVIFRQGVVDPLPGQPEHPGAVFIVRFHLATMSAGLNKIFSLLPIPFFIGLPGFRSKLWTLDENSGDFQGIYEWDTVQDAENYAKSFAVKFMARRSLPGSLSFQIEPHPRNRWSYP